VATRSRKIPDRAILAVLTVAVGAYALLQSLVIPVLPTIQHNLHTSQNTVTWVLTAYLLAASIFTPILGRVGDMYGKERMFVVALSALALGSLLAGLAHSVGLMIVARAIQGVGGGVLPLAFGIIRDEFQPEKVASVVGVIAALTAAGGGLGIVLAGPIVDILGYHWLFWLPLIVVTGAAVAAYLFIPKSPSRTQGRISWLAALLLSGWLVALLVAVSEAPSWGWTSSRVLGLIGGAIVLTILWVFVEVRSEHPLIDMHMMKLPVVWTSNLVALLIGVGIYAVFAFIPEFVQSPRSAGYGFNASITASGLILLPMTVTMFVLGISSGPLTRQFGSKRVLIAGSAASVVPFVLLVVAHDQKWEIALAMAVLGAGFGMAFAAMSTLVVAGVPAGQTGVASGMNANIRTIGGAIGAAAMASIVTSGGTHNGFPREAGYIHGFEMLGAATIAAVVAGFFVPVVRQDRGPDHSGGADMLHAELAIVPGGTLAGDEPE
jgi:EmrB/QacA subfamily drug resistance transporter